MCIHSYDDKAKVMHSLGVLIYVKMFVSKTMKIEFGKWNMVFGSQYENFDAIFM